MLQAYAEGTIFGERTGDQPSRLLCLHGWQRSHLDFAEMLVDANSNGAGRLAAIAIDLPGFGASPAPDEVWDSARYAQAIVPVLDEMDEKVVVLGHSFGGRIALHLAAQLPKRVTGLVLSGVPMPSADQPHQKPPLGYRFVRKLARSGIVGSERLAKARNRHGSRDYREAIGVMRDILVVTTQESYDDILSGLNCPLELVWGEFDTAAPLAQAERAAGLARKAHLDVIRGADHFLPLSHPAILRAAVLRLMP